MEKIKHLSKRIILKLTNPKGAVVFEGKRYERHELDRGFVYPARSYVWIKKKPMSYKKKDNKWAQKF